MATKLNQVVAVEATKKSIFKSKLDKAYHIAQVADVFNGKTRVYFPKEDLSEDTLPSEEKLVETRVEDVVDSIRESTIDFFNITAIKDYSNASAKADVVIGDETLVKDAPVPYLIFLEKKLVDMKTFASKLPVLPTSARWDYSEDKGAHVSETVNTIRFQKVPRTLELAPATTEHPAQVNVWQEDVNVGTWETTLLSGAIPVDTRNEIITRIETLIEAVKVAREEANSADAEDVEPGANIFDHIFKDLTPEN